MFDPATGTWFLRNTASAGVPDIGPFTFGAPGWDAVVGDWDGDGRTTVGVVDRTGASTPTRPSGTCATATLPRPDVTPSPTGRHNVVPVVGDWDGNGTCTVGVFDPTNATWYLRNSNSAGAPTSPPSPSAPPGGSRSSATGTATAPSPSAWWTPPP